MQTGGSNRRGACTRANRGHLLFAASTLWLVAWPVVTPVALTEQVSRASSMVARTEHRVVVELTRRDTFVILPAGANAKSTHITLVRVDSLPSRYRLTPAHGIARVGQSVDILLDKSPDVRIRLSIITRSHELAVKVSPLIGFERGEPVDFTLERIQRTAWSLQRRVKELQQRIATWQKEYQLLATWQATPGNKPLDLVKAVRLRQKLLQRDVLAGQRELPSAQKRYAALCKTAELARQIHGTTVIHFTVGPLSGREQ